MTPTNRWWLDKKVKCKCCETEFILTEETVIIAHYDRVFGGIYIPLTCPVCNLTTKLYK